MLDPESELALALTRMPSDAVDDAELGPMFCCWRCADDAGGGAGGDCRSALPKVAAV